MKSVAVFEAKNRLSEILAAVEQGEEYIVTKHGNPIARIIPARHVDATSVSDAEGLIIQIMSSRKNSHLSDLEYQQAIEEGRD